MSDDTTEYNLKAIRELLLAAFIAEDLRRFCRDDPRFRPIYRRFAPGDGLEDLVDEVIDYCQTRRCKVMDLYQEKHALVQQVLVSSYIDRKKGGSAEHRYDA